MQETKTTSNKRVEQFYKHLYTHTHTHTYTHTRTHAHTHTHTHIHTLKHRHTPTHTHTHTYYTTHHRHIPNEEIVCAKFVQIEKKYVIEINFQFRFNRRYFNNWNSPRPVSEVLSWLCVIKFLSGLSRKEIVLWGEMSKPDALLHLWNWSKYALALKSNTNGLLGLFYGPFLFIFVRCTISKRFYIFDTLVMNRFMNQFLTTNSDCIKGGFGNWNKESDGFSNCTTSTSFLEPYVV